MANIENPEKRTEVEFEKRRIVGVVAIIQSKDRKILVVEETKDKPQYDKRKGDWSLPAETIEEGETEFEALLRLIKEEVGENGDITCDPEKDWIGDYQLAAETNIWGRAFVLHFAGTSRTKRSFTAERGEVINHRWIKPDPKEIEKMPRRRGILEVITDFHAGRRRVVCESCSPGKR